VQAYRPVICQHHRPVRASSYYVWVIKGFTGTWDSITSSLFVGLADLYVHTISLPTVCSEICVCFFSFNRTLALQSLTVVIVLKYCRLSSVPPVYCDKMTGSRIAHFLLKSIAKCISCQRGKFDNEIRKNLLDTAAQTTGWSGFWPFDVIQVYRCTNHKPIYNFLLVNNYDTNSPCHRFRDQAPQIPYM